LRALRLPFAPLRLRFRTTGIVSRSPEASGAQIFAEYAGRMEKPLFCAMPKNKQAYIRYRIIDACIRNKQKPFPTKEELIKACEVIASVSLRTIEQDLYDMQNDEELGYFAPIKYDKRQKGYFYEDSLYSISNIPLKENDLYALEFAVALLRQFEGIEPLAQFSEAVSKIEDYVNVRSLMTDTDVADVIQLEKSTSSKGQEFLNDILSAVKEKRMIRFGYKKFDSSAEKEHVLHPYVLKEYRNRWYVTGKSGTSDHIVTFGLDRITRLEITGNESFEIAAGFNVATYFKYSFGISVSNELKPEAVVLQFTPQQGEYIKSQPLHSTQEIMQDDAGKCVVKITVIPSFELKAQLLSYGSSVKILEPQWLKDEVMEEVRKIMAG
jgi:predicted DNA-binding transcriptional regulator YafY